MLIYKIYRAEKVLQLLSFSIVFCLFTPAIAGATSCDITGYDIVLVNGVLTDRPEADDMRKDLEKALPTNVGAQKVTVLLGHNPIHIAGLGDELESAAQAFGSSISDFDLNTILMQIQPQVSTRKILLLGHSQGTFYTNSMYTYLTNHGVPAESIAVYNLATPADHVEGDGAYLTSANDRVINRIRPLMAKAGAPAPLSANIPIPIPENELNDKAGGHHFSSDYLNGAPDKIVSDIKNALGNLKVGASSATDGCFTPPPKTVGYKTQAALFAVVDPYAQEKKDQIIATGSVIATAAQKAQAAAAYATAQVKSAFSTLFQTSPHVSAGNQGAAVASAVTSPPPTNSSAKTATTPSSQLSTQSAAPRDTLAKAPDPPPPPPQTPPQILGPALVSVAPGFGGGGGAATPDVVAAPAPVIPLTVQTPLEGALFATSSVTFTGTTTPGYSVVASHSDSTATTVADSHGDWSIALTLPEGTTAIGVVAADSEGNTSDAITRTVTVSLPSLTAPTPSVSECTASLSASTCLIATTGAALSWPSVSGAAYYAYAVNGGIVATTTGTSAALSLSTNATSAISVVAYDAAGNAATSTSIDVRTLTQPLIINEIAWTGTVASSNDEWIELKNNSSYAFDNLSHVAIVSADGSPYIQLSGTIASGGYYLIERREEATSVAGDLILAFDQLAGTGEELFLDWGHGNATTTLDRTPAVATCSGWCSGTIIAAMTMERAHGGTDGSLAASWQYGSSTVASVVDASGNIIQGTPRAENSAGGVPPSFGL